MVCEVTDVRIYKLKDSEKQKAFASVTLDKEFAVHGLKVMDGDKGLWLSFPSRKDGQGEYRDIFHPVTKESRQKIISAVLDAYKSETNEN